MRTTDGDLTAGNVKVRKLSRSTVESVVNG